MAPARVRVGCSGWEYPHWRGPFYPQGWPAKRRLEYYAARFDTVEINYSFYRLPLESTLVDWRQRTPPGFCFAVKASRYLTHMKKLRNPAQPLRRLLERIALLGARQGPILFQLPPQLERDDERLGAFLAELPRGLRAAIEFRHASWYDEATYSALFRAGVAMCLHDMQGSIAPRLLVGPFLYLRLHGVGLRYGGAYTDRALRAWADWLAPYVQGGADAYVYFNNDAGGRAPKDAERLRRILDERLEKRRGHAIDLTPRSLSAGRPAARPSRAARRC